MRTRDPRRVAISPPCSPLRFCARPRLKRSDESSQDRRDMRDRQAVLTDVTKRGGRPGGSAHAGHDLVPAVEDGLQAWLGGPPLARARGAAAPRGPPATA